MPKKKDKELLNNNQQLRNLNDLISIDATGTTSRVGRSIDGDMNRFKGIANSLLGDTYDSDGGRSTLKFINSIGTKSTDTATDKATVENINKIYEGNGDMPILSQMYRESQLKNRLYDDYDLIMKFMPQLKGILRDTVVPAILSPNDHTKSFLTLEANCKDSKNWSNELQLLQEKEMLPLKIKALLEDVCYYGVQRVRIVPYSTLMTRINRIAQSDDVYKGLKESYNFTTLNNDENNTIIESISESFDTILTPVSENKINTREITEDMFKRVNEVTIEHIDYEEPFKEMCFREMSTGYNNVDDNGRSIIESYIDTLDAGSVISTLKKSKSENGDKNFIDGLFTRNNVEDNDKDKVNVTGVYYNKENIRNLVPIYIHDIVIGYYKVNMSNKDTMKQSDKTTNLVSNPYNSMTMKDLDKTLNDNREVYADTYTMNFAKLLVKRLNKKFLEDNNQFTSEIYNILRYYDIHNNTMNLKMQFIPAEEIYEIKINNGVSLFDDALFPAKLYIALLISNMMLKLLRGADKRVYYIKQGIDSNVSNSLMQAIMQIKKSEISLSDMGNINRIFGYLGRFNDYFVPISPDGEKPFDFDIMQGQDVQVQDDFMEELKKAAILALGTPYGVTDYDERTDLATRLVAENVKFSYQVIYKQMEITPYLSKMITAYTKALYPGFDKTDTVKVNLPAPINLKINLLSEQIQGLNSLADMISEAVLVDKDSENFNMTKSMLVKRILMKLSDGVLNWSDYSKLADEAILDAKTESEKNKNNTDDGM